MIVLPGRAGLLMLGHQIDGVFHNTFMVLDQIKFMYEQMYASGNQLIPADVCFVSERDPFSNIMIMCPKCGVRRKRRKPIFSQGEVSEYCPDCSLMFICFIVSDKYRVGLEPFRYKWPSEVAQFSRIYRQGDRDVADGEVRVRG
jgi:hypothetical protein